MVDGQLGALVGKLTTKRQGLPTELKTELLAKGILVIHESVQVV